MNLVSRKMVIEELKDKFLVRRTRMEVGKWETVSVAESGICGSIRRAVSHQAFFSAPMQKGH
ncbi:hypothetical protein, partial [Shigella sonnei]|uniref:hypothetical protein n=1 Tax=Shigella sonnei TaxID=624 RepID=UPI001C0A735B